MSEITSKFFFIGSSEFSDARSSGVGRFAFATWHLIQNWQGSYQIKSADFASSMCKVLGEPVSVCAVSRPAVPSAVSAVSALSVEQLL